MERFPWTVTLTFLSLFVYILDFRTALAIPVEDESYQGDENAKAPAPEVVNASTTYLVAEGDTLRMPCNVIKNGNAGLIWNKGTAENSDSTLFLDDSPVPYGINVDNYRINKEDHSLTIVRANADSAGLYTCSTDPQHQAEHHVQLKVSVELGRVSKLVEAGGNLTLSCTAKGDPEPKVEWYRKRSSGSSGAELLGTGAERTIANVQVFDSGTYTCSASNGVSNATTSISIKVVNGLSVESDIVFVDLRDNTASICCIQSKGSAHNALNWLKDGNVVPVLSQYKVTSPSKHKQCLQIKGVQEKDLGVYTCKSEKSQVSTNLTGAPQKPKLTKVTSDKTNPLSPVPVLVWNVSTFAPILSYQIYVRKQGDTEWRLNLKQEALISDEKEEVIERRFDQLPNGVYATKLVVQNRHGSSELISEDMPLVVDMKEPASESGKGSAGRSYAGVGVLLTILAALLLCR